VRNLDTVLREKEQQVEMLQTEIEALRLVSLLLKEEAESAPPRTAGSNLASVPAPTHVMQSSSVGGGFEREGGYSTSGLKQFP
jgi:hypothetical protein